MRHAFWVTCAAILVWSAAAAADELPVIQTGVKSFGLNRPDSPDWPLQKLPDWTLQKPPRGGPTIWTSPPITFARPFGTKPTGSVAIAGIESGANLNTDRLGFSVEATDVDATGFKIIIRRTQGGLIRHHGDLARLQHQQTVTKRYFASLFSPQGSRRTLGITMQMNLR